MRPIKFRSWDKERKLMFQDVQKTYDTLECTIRLPDGKDEVIWARSFGELLEDETNIIMQFTGLLDKHGKEIYEGDIVGNPIYKWNDISKQHDIISSYSPHGEVVFDQMKWTEKTHGSFESHSIMGWVIKDNYFSYNKPLTNDVIILGNIYEYPHLMEKK